MQPHVNEVVNQKALLRKLRDEVAQLRKQLVSTLAVAKHLTASLPGALNGYAMQLLPGYSSVMFCQG